MKLRFQADNDLRQAIVRAVVRRECLIDFRDAREAHLDGKPDREVLLFSARAGRILISHDFATMPGHFREFLRDHDSPGVLLIPQDLPIWQAAESIILA